ncbi:hypothetical protein ABI59_20110 [Acidobacteria bacterium Mor1]|nr:hypothetical protein ABI59_20110 [Acidobacteria bacterium Mor1]
MKHSCLAIALAVTALLGTTTSAAPVAIGETDSLRSKLLDEDRPYRVALPGGFDPDSGSYPVVYLLGGEDLFHYTSAVLRLLAHEDLMPPAILVGVEHTARTRDLAPAWKSPDSPAHMQRFIADSGGADRYGEFLTRELAPHIEANYPTAPFRILVGRSLGGLFTLHTLFNAPAGFDGYIAISPSTHWDNAAIIGSFESFLEREAGGSNEFLFLSKADETGESLETYHRLIARLKQDAPKHLRWSHREFTEDDHGSTFMPGVHRGLRAIFDGWRTPADLQKQGLEGFDTHFAGLSRRYGYEIPVPESTINTLGLRTMMLGDPAKGANILTQSVERYPRSAYARFCLGWALEEEGKLEQAVALFQQAVTMGSASSDPNLPTYKDRLDRLRRRAAEEN